MSLPPPRALQVVACAATLAACAVGHNAGVATPASAPAAWQTKLDADSPLVGKVWSTASASFVVSAQVDDALARADFVLLGEQHENPDHHRLQAEAIASLVRAGRRPTIALEMLEPESDVLVERYRGGPQATAAGLGGAVGWDKSGWPDWSMYRPIAEVAFDAGLPLLSANLPHALVRRIVHEGLAALGPGEPARLGLDVELAAPLESSLEGELVASHCGQLPAAMVGPMALAQRARDGQMADRLLGAHGGPAVLVAGAGHVRTDRGVPLRIRAARPGARVVSVAFVEVDRDRTTPESYAGRYAATRLPFDFVWFTPRANDDDPCKGMHIHSS